MLNKYIYSSKSIFFKDGEVYIYHYMNDKNNTKIYFCGTDKALFFVKRLFHIFTRECECKYSTSDPLTANSCFIHYYEYG